MSESYKNINNTELLRIKSFSVQICICLCTIFLSGCSYFISSATVDMTANLSQAISDNNDLATVEAGGPAFLLMVDSLLYRDPDNESLLRSAANVYTAYTSVFVKDTARAKKLTDKALDYALRAMCIRRPDTCLFRQISFQEFKHTLSTLNVKDVPDLFTLGSAWSGWMARVHPGTKEVVR